MCVRVARTHSPGASQVAYSSRGTEGHAAQLAEVAGRRTRARTAALGGGLGGGDWRRVAAPSTVMVPANQLAAMVSLLVLAIVLTSVFFSLTLSAVTSVVIVVEPAEMPTIEHRLGETPRAAAILAVHVIRSVRRNSLIGTSMASEKVIGSALLP